ncbi:MAG TPA: DUF6159 family protein [Candidatus Limnocylindrales bacterium]|nr:DUF6159 family protein [Candidatus Limnocylindrales bacterium]
MTCSRGAVMFQTFSRSLELAKASLSVLRSDKELLVFPLISFIALVVVTISFAVPLWLTGAVADAVDGKINIPGAILAFLFYLVSYTVTFFFNTALVGAAMIRLDGGDPTLRDGFRIAMSRLPQIIAYALIAATVGMILRWISERAGFVGQIVAGIVGFGWSVATFLVVPILVLENVGPVDAIKRSASLLRKTWGEQLVGNFGIGLIFGLLALVALVIGVALIVAIAQVSTILAGVAVVVTALIVGAIALVGAAASGIFTASLYRYATKGDPGPAFRTETISAAFRPGDGAPAGVATFGGPR